MDIFHKILISLICEFPLTYVFIKLNVMAKKFLILES